MTLALIGLVAIVSFAAGWLGYRKYGSKGEAALKDVQAAAAAVKKDV